MKSTGVIRKVDELGRFVIPKEIRNQLGVTNEDNELEIFVVNDEIVLKKPDVRSCIFCGSKEQTTEFMGKYVCAECVLKLK